MVHAQSTATTTGTVPPTSPRPSLRLVSAGPGVGRASAAVAGARVGRRPAVRPSGRPAARSGAAGARPVRGGGWYPAGPVVAPSSGGWHAEPPLRLTRWGRRVVAAVSVAIGLGVAAGAVAVVAAEEPALQLAGAVTVVVQPGDTLWSIAGDVAPDEDRRAVVDAIRDRNDLDDVVLHPGQVIELP